MKLLLDTHVLIWAVAAPHWLSRRASDLIVDPDNDRFISAVSAYEIDYKRERDAVLAGLPELDAIRETLVCDWLPIEVDHASRAARLPRHHRDPWDRLLVAQAMAEGLTIISIDPALTRYGAPVLW